MTRQEIKGVVATVITMLARVAAKTRTPADDLLIQVLRRNEGKLVQAVEQAMATAGQNSPTETQIVNALQAVGIDVG